MNIDTSNFISMPPEIPLIQPWLNNYGPGSTETRIESIDIPPRVIYRYLAPDRAIEAVQRKYLWFSSPNSFNDPLDMYKGLVDFSVNKNQAKDFAKRNKQGQGRSVKRSTAKDVLKQRLGLEKYQKKVFEDIKANSGVCCFSKRADNMLLWSHYAKNHSGICLGFNIEPFRSTPLFFVQPVRYPVKVEAASYYDEKEKILSHWILTKSNLWAYEEEIRAFCLSKNGSIVFDKDCLKEVYFGCNTSKKDRQSMIELLKAMNYHSVNIKELIINEKTFNIEVSEFNLS